MVKKLALIIFLVVSVVFGSICVSWLKKNDFLLSFDKIGLYRLPLKEGSIYLESSDSRSWYLCDEIANNDAGSKLKSWEISRPVSGVQKDSFGYILIYRDVFLPNNRCVVVQRLDLKTESVLNNCADSAILWDEYDDPIDLFKLFNSNKDFYEQEYLME